MEIFLIIVGIILSVVITFWVAKKYLQKIGLIEKKKPGGGKAKDQVSINATRYTNYGHPFDIVEYIGEIKKKVKLPYGTLLSFSFDKSKPDSYYFQDTRPWHLILKLTDSMDAGKTTERKIDLEHYTTSYQKGRYSVAYDNREIIRVAYDTQEKPDIALKKDIKESLDAVIKKYIEDYPFEFAQEKREGIV